MAAYHQLAGVEARFRTVKDFLQLRPVRHWTEQRVRGHVAICVYAAVIETLIGCDLAKADIRDPDLDHQHLSAARALRELNRIRRVKLTANGHNINLHRSVAVVTGHHDRQTATTGGVRPRMNESVQDKQVSKLVGGRRVAAP